MLKIAINGYGRIGRNFHRQIIGEKDMRVVAINTRADTEMRSYLLKYDSLHGPCQHPVEVQDDKMIVDGHEVKNFAFKEIKDIPWNDEDIDIVVDSTGCNTTFELASQHIDAGAKRVVISAPMKDDTPTFVIGVNEKDLKAEHTVVSNASCTTNCIAPVMMIMDDHFGIENAFASSIHSYTSSQNLLDNNASDFRRARSAVMSVIPTTTGSIKSVQLILPNLKGKVDGMAFRVPIATSSVADMRFVLKKDASAEEINNIFKEEAKKAELEGIIMVNEEPLVSIDFKTDPHSSIIDAPSTKVVDGKYVQMLAWYDNEWAYAKRLVELAKMVGKHI